MRLAGVGSVAASVTKTSSIIARIQQFKISESGNKDDI